MQITLIGENFVRLWKPDDLNRFLAGCQECLVLFAQALQRNGFKVKVYLHGPTNFERKEYGGILYEDFSEFKVEENLNTIVLFKINPLPVHSALEQLNVIFWSSDVQSEVVPNRYIKQYVCLTDYHKNRNGWKDAMVIPHGIDFVSLFQNKMNKETNTMLYCSSPDRGLVDLLRQWSTIKQYYPEMKLFITYGFKITKQIIDRNTVESEEELKQFCHGKDITYLADIDRDQLEKLFWKCQYWILPLNNADSELFCLSAVKAQLCGCIPIVNRIGALTETVGDYIDFNQFCLGKSSIMKAYQTPTYSWDDVILKYWMKLIVN